ncbi:MAG: hypothetical protein HYX27_18465 [Acidobacteria bacterium]|nr:hypothetical protein [Acidobacteriota bacterium]
MSRLVVLTLAILGVWGQGRVMGTITVADPGHRQLSLQTDQGELYAIKVLPEAKVQKIAPGQTNLSNAEAIELGTLTKGDRILARGQQDAAAKTMLAGQVVVIPKQSIESRDAARQQEWKTSSLAGVVKTVNPLTIQSRGNTTWTVDPSANKTVHQYADDSSKFANAKAAQLSDLQPGDQVKVLGARDAEAKTVKASEIVFGRFTTLGGEIKSIDTANQTVTVYDLSTKKNVTIQVSRDARMTRLSGSPGGGSSGFGPRGPTPNGPQGGGPRGPGFAGGGAGPDPSMLLERLPPAKFSDLQTGDAVVLTVGKASTSRPVALSLVAGLDFLLRAPAQQATQMIANWNVEGGLQ